MDLDKLEYSLPWGFCFQIRMYYSSTLADWLQLINVGEIPFCDLETSIHRKIEGGHWTKWKHRLGLVEKSLSKTTPYMQTPHSWSRSVHVRVSKSWFERTWRGIAWGMLQKNHRQIWDFYLKHEQTEAAMWLTLLLICVTCVMSNEIEMVAIYRFEHFQ